MTSPEREPLKLVAVVAVVALPINAAVIVPATKLPLASRTTISLATLELEILASLSLVIVVLVISLSTINDDDKLPEALLCTTPAEVNPSIITVPVELIAMRSTPTVSKESLSATEAKIPVPVLLPVNSIDGADGEPAGSVSIPVRVPPAKGRSRDALPVTLPMRAAVMVPAEKLPLVSRRTIVLGVFVFVAVVAEFATLPAVEMVASLLSVIAAEFEISALTINDDDKLPELSLWTTPVEVNPSIDTVPPEEILSCSVPLVLNERLPLDAESPVVVLPVNTSDGDVVEPAGS